MQDRVYGLPRIPILGRWVNNKPRVCRLTLRHRLTGRRRILQAGPKAFRVSPPSPLIGPAHPFIRTADELWMKYPGWAPVGSPGPITHASPERGQGVIL